MERCLRIKGRVQGVGYRYWAVRRAKEIGGISGYIHNEENGDVLAYISGESQNLDRLQALFYEGPFFSRVDSIESVPECISFFPPLENGVFKRI